MKKDKIIVLKFGGTSVSSEEKREKVADRVVDAIHQGYSPVVVVSAMGRKPAPYATDTLISLLNDFENIRSKRELDMLMSCGEIISSVVVVHTLKNRGLRAEALNGQQAGMITNNKFGDAEIVKTDPKRLFKTIEKGIIPVVSGFQGITDDNEITTMGRGSSDTTAAILGGVLKAERVDIFTDVDGIMTADPKIVPNAKVLDSMEYEEVFQMAEQGAKVVHPRAVEAARRYNVKLMIRNTMTEAKGTAITASRIGESIKETQNPEYVATGIAVIKNRIQLYVYNTDQGKENELLDRLTKNNISIDMINVFLEKIIFTIDKKDKKEIEEILKSLGFQYHMIKDCAKVSVLGNRMRGVPGVMRHIIKTLVAERIEVLQSVDSHSTISCLVHGNDAGRAVRKLHEAFHL